MVLLMTSLYSSGCWESKNSCWLFLVKVCDCVPWGFCKQCCTATEHLSRPTSKKTKKKTMQQLHSHFQQNVKLVFKAGCSLLGLSLVSSLRLWLSCSQENIEVQFRNLGLVSAFEFLDGWTKPLFFSDVRYYQCTFWLWYWVKFRLVSAVLIWY